MILIVVMNINAIISPTLRLDYLWWGIGWVMLEGYLLEECGFEDTAYPILHSLSPLIVSFDVDELLQMMHSFLGDLEKRKRTIYSCALRSCFVTELTRLISLSLVDCVHTKFIRRHGDTCPQWERRWLRERFGWFRKIAMLTRDMMR